MVTIDAALNRSTVLARRKPEDTAEGCRRLAQGNRAQAAGSPSEHMRGCLERSADAWTARAVLLERLEASFNARSEAQAREQLRQRQSRRKDDG